MIDNRVEEIRKHVESISHILGIPVTESNENTPLRVAKMWVNELFRNRNDCNLAELDASMKVFPNVDNLSNMVVMNDIQFHSMCEHHWLPFSGEMNIAYIPNKSIIGLSKIPRAVKFFSAKPQLQERLVQEIGEYLVKIIHPRFLIVEAVATHDCVMCRGVESSCSTNSLYTFSDEENAVHTPRLMHEFFMRRNRRDSEKEV